MNTQAYPANAAVLSSSIKSKRILISCSAGGSLLSFRGKLIEELVKRNYKVFVFTPPLPEQRKRMKLEEMGAIIYENKLRRNNISIMADIQYLFQLRKLIKQIKPDIFFSYTFKPLIFGTFMASACGVKNIVAMLTGLGYNFTEGSGKVIGKLTQRLLEFSLKSSNRIKVIFQNEDDYKELIERKIIVSKKPAFVVNGSGVDLSHYQFTIPQTDTISFLMMGRLVKAKGVQEYYEAAKIIKEKYPDIKFKLIGWYEESNIDCISDELYQKINAGDIVEFEGPKPDVRPYIQKSSVVVLPSYREGTPRSVLEALSMGRAVITTDTPGCRQTIDTSSRNENGFLIPVKDAESLAAKMEYYIHNPQEVIRHGNNGRQYAEQKFDVHKVNKQMLEILEQI